MRRRRQWRRASWQRHSVSHVSLRRSRTCRARGRARPVRTTTDSRCSCAGVRVCSASPTGCWAAQPKPRTSSRTSGCAGKRRIAARFAMPRRFSRRRRHGWRSTSCSRLAHGAKPASGPGWKNRPTRRPWNGRGTKRSARAGCPGLARKAVAHGAGGLRPSRSVRLFVPGHRERSPARGGQRASSGESRPAARRHRSTEARKLDRTRRVLESFVAAARSGDVAGLVGALCAGGRGASKRRQISIGGGDLVDASAVRCQRTAA